MSEKIKMADVIEVVEEITGEKPADIEESIKSLIKFTHDKTLDKVVDHIKATEGKVSGYVKLRGLQQWVYKQQGVAGYQDGELH